MIATSVAEPTLKAHPLEVRCRACGGWLATVPPGTAWARGRCYGRTNGRPCPLYGQGQTVKLRTPTSAPTGDVLQ